MSDLRLLAVLALSFLSACSGDESNASSNPLDGGSMGGSSNDAAMAGGAAGTGGAAAAGGSTTATGGTTASGGGATSSGTGGTPAIPLQCTQSDSARCLCSTGTTPLSNPVPVCSPASINGYCCADSTFPDVGFCSCRQWTCNEDSIGCSCGSTQNGTSSRCHANWSTCCMITRGTASTCFCDDLGLPCDAGSTAVPNCDVANVRCGPGENPAATCDVLPTGAGGSPPVGTGGASPVGTGGTSPGGTGGVGTGGSAADTCIPSTLSCNGNVLAMCNAFGDGYQPGGTDCSATGNVCASATCKPVICNGTLDCKSGDVYECHFQGTASLLYKDCGSTQHCEKNGDSASCVSNVCVPNRLACNGDVLGTCNADGSGYQTSTDCAANGGTCYPPALECRPKLCEAFTYRCSNGDGKNGSVYQCGPYGITETLMTACADAFAYCHVEGTYASCASDICKENQLDCDGSKIGTCNADGSGFVSYGTDCATLGNKNCREGACYDVICKASSPYCVADTLMGCDATGTVGTEYFPCAAEQYCRAGSATTAAACVYDICKPSGPACNVERTTTCTANGGGFAAGGTDCSATGKVCALQGGTAQCATEALDTVASSVSNIVGSPGTLWVDYYSVFTNRTLTEIRQALQLPTGTSVVTWVVYEQIGTGDLTKIFEKAVPTPGDATMKVQTSGAINVPLVAGRQYVIGVSTDSNVGNGSFAGPFPLYYLSFGAWLGGTYTTFVTLPATTPLAAFNFQIGFPIYQVLKTTA